MTVTLDRPVKTCMVEDCTTDASARSLCNKHYKRLMRHGDTSVVMAPGRPMQPEQPVCICDEPDVGSDCERCGGGYGFGACHRCHLPVGERFAEVRAAWREYLAVA